MRLIHLSASDAGFKDLHFEPGFNLLLADRTKEATRKDTRNGLGKSTAIELIHFCLGRGVTRGQVPVVDDLAGWSFSLEVEILGEIAKLTRYVNSPSVIEVDRDPSTWPIRPERSDESSDLLFQADDLQRLVALDWAGLPISGYAQKYAPSWGSVRGYFSRRGAKAYLDPFKHHDKQAEWDKQVNVAYLIGLRWQDAANWQILKDRKRTIDQLKKAMREGLFSDQLESEGALEAERVRLTGALADQREALKQFRVHDQYREIEKEASSLTEQMHFLSNENFSDRRAIELYEQAIHEESSEAPSSSDLASVYEEAGLILPESITARLEEVESFHAQIVDNRREYLETEIARLQGLVRVREAEIERFDAGRAELMQVLTTHGALDEFIELQERVNHAAAALSDTESQIKRLRELKEAKDRYDDDLRELERSARAHYEELQAVRDSAIRSFNENTEALYEEPGRLVIDIGATGFKYGVEIERARSDGVSKMKIFCFDLTLCQHRARQGANPGVLIHDSLLFDGVDERQKGLALHRAATEAEAGGWQYFCTFNSDEFPGELPEGSPALAGPIATLTDATDDGMLLGRRFK